MLSRNRELTCGGCSNTWSARALKYAHCSACHVTFSTVNNFDRHRRSFQCLTVEESGLVLNSRGIAHQPGHDGPIAEYADCAEAYVGA